MQRTGFLAASLLLLVPLLASVTAQEPEPEFNPYVMEITAEPTRVEVGLGVPGQIALTIHDKSIDGPGGIGATLGQDTPTAAVNPHTLTFDVEPRVDDPGWTVSMARPIIQSVYAGDTVENIVYFQALPAASTPEYVVDVNVTLSGSQGETSQVIQLSGYNPGIPVFAALGRNPGVAGPNEIVSAPVTIQNFDLQPRSFSMEVVQNPCGLDVVPPQNNLVDARSTETFTVDMQTPDDKIWYFYESCPVRLQVFGDDEPDEFQTVVFNVQLNGGYINPMWVFWTVVIIAAILLLFLVAKRRKEAVEEEILGKPQKPWTIPAEKVYLEHLEERDPRAAYVVRHYLMEDEYRSALLWYESYKKATKGERKKERLIVKVEHDVDKNRRKWEKRIAAPIKSADKYEARLQRKLQKKADKRHRKAMKAYDKRVEKIEAAHDKDVERAQKKWEKQAKRAEKKGEPVPAEPDLGAPDLPEEPQRENVSLADHKWQAKADKYRAAMEKKQEKLRAKAERDQAKKVRKARKKAQKIARKLDDPAFIEEHPILSDSDAASV